MLKWGSKKKVELSHSCLTGVKAMATKVYVRLDWEGQFCLFDGCRRVAILDPEMTCQQVAEEATRLGYGLAGFPDPDESGCIWRGHNGNL